MRSSQDSVEQAFSFSSSSALVSPLGSTRTANDRRHQRYGHRSGSTRD